MSTTASNTIDFRILSAVRVVVDGSTLDIGGTRPRAVLALLLLNRGRPISADRIVEELWVSPPRTSRNSVQRFVADLRRAGQPIATRLSSSATGYQLSVSTEELDLARFEAALADAGHHRRAGRPEAEAESLRTALDQWDGPEPLGGIGDPPFADLERTRLGELRLTAHEQRIQADLALGGHQDLIAELEALAAAHPFREGISALLMTALYRSGRQREALEAFQRLRATLVEELGVEPAPEIRELERRILDQESDPAPVIGASPGRGAGPAARGYEVGTVLGSGSDATVRQARQLSTGRDVALKVIDASRADHPPFIREFDETNRGVAGLEHPHIVPLYDWWREPSAAYVVMRLLRGGTLHGEVELDPEARRAALAQVGDALRVAHGRGIHHGAVSSANVLLDTDGNAYLTDFGIADVATPIDDVEGLYHLVEEVLPGRLGDASFDSVDDVMRALHAPVRPRSDIASPYKGLRAFLESDASEFFGRDALVGAMTDRVRRSRFLALIGPSGSGKSSVVRAGLIPGLRRGSVPGSERWFIVDMVPGAAPLDELARAVRRVAVDPPEDLRSLLADGPDGLRRVVDLVLPEPGTEMLLVIDQFEELFTLVPSDRARTRFVESLVDAVEDPRSRLRCVATMRADFYDRPLGTPGLGPLFRTGTETVVPLTAEELERAIVGPAERVGVTFEPALVGEMVGEVTDQPATLPLLQYALTEMFERRSSDHIGRDLYQQVGGVLGALARRADWLHQSLSGPQQLILRQLLLRLVTVGDDSRNDTRRRVSRRELTGLDESGSVERVLDEFGRHRLLTFDRDPTSGDPVVEVAHEALLREWTRLRDWIEQSRDDLRQHRRVAAGASEWVQANRDPSFLVGGSRLERIEGWRESTSITLTDDEADFIRTSVEARRAEEATERARLEREAELEQRANRRLRLLVGVLAIAAVVATALSLFAFQQSREADDQRAEAESQAQRVTIQGLASAALADIADDPERSLLLALESLRMADVAALAPPADAIEALHDGLDRHRLIRRLGTGVRAVYSPDGGLIAMGTAAGAITIVETESGSTVLTIDGAHRGSVLALRFDHGGGRLLTSGEDGPARLWDVASGLLLATLPGDAPQPSLDFSPDGSRIVTGSRDGSLQIWDATSGELIVRRVLSQVGPAVRVSALARWLADGRLIVTSEAEASRVVVADPETLDPIEVLDTRGDDFCVLEASVTGQFVIGLWNAAPALVDSGPEPGAVDLTGHSSVVCAAAFSADGMVVATGSADGTIRLWSTDDGGSRLVLPGHVATVESVAIDPGGGRLLSASSGGEVFEWDVDLGMTTELFSLFDTSRHAVLSNDGTRVAIATVGELSVFDVDTGELIARLELPAENPNPIDLLDISADGRLLSVPQERIGIVELLAVDTLTSVSVLDGAPVAIRASRFDPSGELLVGLGGDGSLHAWSIADQRIVWSTEPSDAEGVEFSPDGARIALIDPHGLRILSAVTGDTSAGFDMAQQLALTWLDDGRLATSGLSGVVTTWDLAESGDNQQFTTADGVQDLAYDEVNERLVVGHLDGGVSIWSLAEPVELLSLPVHSTTVLEVDVDDAGSRVLSVDFDGLIHVRTLDTATLIDIAERRVTRQLTDEECSAYGAGSCRD